MELDVTSDYYPIVSNISWDTRFQEYIQRLKLSFQIKLLFDLLKNEIACPNIILENTVPSSLDSLAQELSTAIKKAYCGSARGVFRKGTGKL